MKNMEPDKKSLIIYKESIFNKIKYFFKHLFNRNKEINYTVQMQEKDNVKKIIRNIQKTFNIKSYSSESLHKYIDRLYKIC